jgi:hypothetical protein
LCNARPVDSSAADPLPRSWLLRAAVTVLEMRTLYVPFAGDEEFGDKATVPTLHAILTSILTTYYYCMVAYVRAYRSTRAFSAQDTLHAWCTFSRLAALHDWRLAISCLFGACVQRRSSVCSSTASSRRRWSSGRCARRCLDWNLRVSQRFLSRNCQGQHATTGVLGALDLSHGFEGGLHVPRDCRCHCLHVLGLQGALPERFSSTVPSLCGRHQPG